MLERFLKQRETKIAQELEWLRNKKVDCVLSDSAFLAWYVTFPLLAYPLFPIFLPPDLHAFFISRILTSLH